MNPDRKRLLFIIIIGVFFFLRIFHLEESVNFSTDQSLGMLETYHLYQAKKLTLIGQTGSSWTEEGRYIFFGSLPYYIYMPVLYLANWQPLSISYLFIFLQFISLIILYRTITRVLKDWKLAIFFSFIFSLLPVVVEHSNYLWAPNLLIPLSVILIALVIKFMKAKHHRFILSGLTGLVGGIGFYIHPSFILAVGIVFGWVAFRRKWNLASLLFFIGGLVLGISPLIMFDLRHDFYNIRTVLFIFSESPQGAHSSAAKFNPHYLFPVIPFVLYAFSVVLKKIQQVNRFIVPVIFTGLGIYSFLTVLSVPSHGFGMPEGWNYPGVRKAEKIILSENVNDFNLIDLLTGDVRATSLRYLLIIDHKPPKTVDEYPDTQRLFIYSRLPVEEILKGNLWEIDVIRPVKFVKQWDIQNGVRLYLVERTKEPDTNSK